MVDRMQHSLKANRPAAFVLLVLLCSHAKGAFTLQPKNGAVGTPPATTTGTGNLPNVIEAAAAWWNERLSTGNGIVINYQWGTTDPTDLAETSVTSSAAGEILDRTITFNRNLTSWFIDSTPYQHAEFENLALGSANFGGYNLNSRYQFASANGLAANRHDLFSTALHELGHALALSSASHAYQFQTQDSDVDFIIPLIFDGYNVQGGRVNVESDSAHLSVSTALMKARGGAAGVRRFITGIDAAAVGAFTGGLRTPVAQRIDTIASNGVYFGDFDSPQRWLFSAGGHLVPDAFTKVRFDGSKNHQLEFDSHAESYQLHVAGGTQVLDLNSYRYRLHDLGMSGQNPLQTLRVGNSFIVDGDDVASLRLFDGILETPDAWIDGFSTSSTEFPTLIVDTNAALDVNTDQFNVGYQRQGKVQQQGIVTAETISIGVLSGSSGLYEMNGAEAEVDAYEISIGRAAGAFGEFRLQNGVIDTWKLEIGEAGVGSFTQTGGRVNVAEVARIGEASTGNGTYHLVGGNLVNAAGVSTYIGYEGRGTIVQDGGTVRVGDKLVLGYVAGARGFYELNGGQVTTPSLYVGLGGFSQFVQGGELSLSISDHLYIGILEDSSGYYELNGGRIQTRLLELGGNPGTAMADGRLTINAGSVEVTGDAVVGIYGTGVVVQYGGTVDIAHTLTIGRSSGSIGRYELRGGTLDISLGEIRLGDGSATFQFAGGTLHVGTFNGNLTNEGGILAPGDSAGTTVINGDYSQLPNGALEIEIAESGHDFLSVAGLAKFAGDLTLSFLNGFLPAATDVYTVIDADSIDDRFDNVAFGGRLDTIDGIGSFLVNTQSIFDRMQIVLSSFLLNAPLLAGDYNDDGTVNAVDYTVWRNHSGQSFVLANENPAALTPGLVDREDYDFWKSRYGNTNPGAGAALDSTDNSAVPEPATAMLLFIGAILSTGIQRRGANRRTTARKMRA